MSDKAMLRQALNEYKQVKQDGEECFILPSGKHTRMKYDLKSSFQNAFHRAQIAEAFAEAFARSSIARFVTVLAGQESMRLFFEELTQHYHYPFREVRIALVKKNSDGKFFLDKSFVPHYGDRYLIVDDVLTTGRTLCNIRNAVLAGIYFRIGRQNPDIVGGAVIVNRMPEQGALVPYVPEPLVSLLYDHEYPLYAPGECPFCRQT